jgi:hypothetical protein
MKQTKPIHPPAFARGLLGTKVKYQDKIKKEKWNWKKK